MADIEESNLVQHARQELEFAGVEEDVRPSILAAIQAFSSYGHSGGSASIVIPMINRLLQFQNISPLTDNPDEWNDVAEFSGRALWQSRRRADAFSEDGGKTYYCLDEKRRWIPWSLRKKLRGINEYLVFPKHYSNPYAFIIGVAE